MGPQQLQSAATSLLILAHLRPASESSSRAVIASHSADAAQCPSARCCYKQVCFRNRRIDGVSKLGVFTPLHIDLSSTSKRKTQIYKKRMALLTIQPLVFSVDAAKWRSTLKVHMIDLKASIRRALTIVYSRVLTLML